MTLRVTLLLVSTLFAANAMAAEDSAEARAARYYAQGLEQPLLQLRTGALLMQACKDRLRKACDEEQRKLAAGNQVLTLLDALTLFPQRPAADPVAAIDKPGELREKIGQTSAALLRAAGDYDLALFARYGATLLACPRENDSDAYHGSLISLRLVELVGFQGKPAPEVSAAVDANLQDMQRETAAWRHRPPEDCLAARKLGEYLMELMNSKLRPWSDPVPAAREGEFNFDQPKAAPPAARTAGQTRELAHAVAGNFVAVVATELQLLVFPESAARIKELADQAGFPAEG